ncbi:cytochrome b/b6 domain-containing protein [Acuticoccus kandeliae]|uniref:cytochrome b/b6 domain-containing protein n=1 Tax=Acuticoccus kandeliae TaxID=2073160 RepID=UPI0014730139|nr:cytochrome b/b6 domain-containing protein [Acuticoccus kandeliae]
MTTTAAPPFRSSRYTAGAILLHWVIAILVILQIASGYAMGSLIAEGSPLQYDVFQLHKSFGISVLVLTVARIMWRLFNAPPAEPASVSRLEAWAAHAVHWIFYLLLLVIPLSGWILISVTPVQVETILYFNAHLPWPNLPGLDALALEDRRSLTGIIDETHEILGYAMGALVLLHIAGALKHQFADGSYLRRMSFLSGGDGARRAFGYVPTILVTLLFAGAMIGVATLVRGGGSESAGATPAAPAATAESVAPAVAEDGAVTAWTLVPEESSVGFAFTFQGSPVNGAIGAFTTDIRFDPDNLEGSSIAVDLDLSSATVEGTAVTASQLTGADGFAVATDPGARFESQTIAAAADGSYLAEGTLTLRGKTVPVTLPFTLAIADGRAVADGTVELDRMAFQIGEQNDPGGSWISPKVSVSVHVTAVE